MCNAPQEQCADVQQERAFLTLPFSAAQLFQHAPLSEFHSPRSAVSDRSLRQMPQENR